MDILFEVRGGRFLDLSRALTTVSQIAQYLKPVTLLTLTRVSQGWRKSLLCNSAKHMYDWSSCYLTVCSDTFRWTAARRNMHPALPDCPPGMNEAEFAELLFGLGCDVCMFLMHDTSTHALN